jgi:hypothetical protein
MLTLPFVLSIWYEPAEASGLTLMAVSQTMAAEAGMIFLIITPLLADEFMKAEGGAFRFDSQ